MRIHFSEDLRKLLKKSLILRRFGRKWRSLYYGDLGWSGILDKDRNFWEDKLKNQTLDKNVLVATSFGGELTMPILESMVSASLVLRGAKVNSLLCDGLPACQLCDTTKFSDINSFVKNGIPRTTCKDCFNSGNKIYNGLGLKPLKYSDFLQESDYNSAKHIVSCLDFESIKNYSFEGVAVGQHAISGTCRFFAKATFEDETFALGVVRRYLEAAILVVIASKRIFNDKKFDVAFFNHGIYVPQGVIGDVARQNSVRVVNWNTAYKKKSFIFSHGDTYHHKLMNEPVSNWENINLNEEQTYSIKNYIESRAKGNNDWIKFNDSDHIDSNLLYSRFGLSVNKPIIGLLTNVAWDAQLHYPANAFPNMLSWIIETIKYFINRQELQLIIRIHPAEITGNLVSRQKVVDEISKNFPLLPSNIKVITPEDNISTYAVMGICDSVLIYGTKTGVELTSMGIPVIVAGEAWIRNKGITTDVHSREQYLEVLNKLPFGYRLPLQTQERARKYAFHFFFRRMIPINCIEPTNGAPPFIFKLDSLKDLNQGVDLGLDIICDGILNGNEFIYPAENL